MPFFAPFVIAGAAAAGVTALVRSANKRWKRQRDVWQFVADSRHGQFHYNEGIFSGSKCTMTVAVGSALTFTDIYTESVGQSSVTYTRCRAAMPLGYPPDFRVARAHIFSSLGTALGAQDIEIGDPDFDERFVIKGDAPHVLPTLWTPRLRKLMLSFPHGMVRAKNGVITFTEPKVYRYPGPLNAAIDLVGGLADTDLMGRSALHAIEGATYQETSGAWDARTRPTAALDLPARVVIGPRRLEDRLYTEAKVAGRTALAPIEVTIGPEVIPTNLPNIVHPHARRIGAAKLVIDARGLRILWPEIESDPQKLRQAAEFLALLASHTPHSPMR